MLVVFIVVANVVAVVVVLPSCNFLAAVEAGRWCLAVKKSLPGKKIAKPSFRSLNIAWMVQYFFG